MYHENLLEETPSVRRDSPGAEKSLPQRHPSRLGQQHPRAEQGGRLSETTVSGEEPELLSAHRRAALSEHGQLRHAVLRQGVLYRRRESKGDLQL